MTTKLTTTARKAVEPPPNPHLSGFTPCAVQPFDEPWPCRTIDVPFDRADPTAGTIHLAVYALAHVSRALVGPETRAGVTRARGR